MRFYGYSAIESQRVVDAQPVLSVGPKTFFELLIFSVAVSVTTQVIIRFIYKDK